MSGFVTFHTPDGHEIAFRADAVIGRRLPIRITEDRASHHSVTIAEYSPTACAVLTLSNGQVQAVAETVAQVDAILKGT